MCFAREFLALLRLSVYLIVNGYLPVNNYKLHNKKTSNTSQICCPFLCVPPLVKDL